MMCTHFDKKFGCGGCENFIKSVDVTVDGDNLVIELPNPTRDLVNKQDICFCIVQPIPVDITSDMTVIVQLGDTVKLPLVTKSVNFVYADQLMSRKMYHTNIATDTSTLVVCGRELRRTRHVFPNIPVVVVPLKEE